MTEEKKKHTVKTDFRDSKWYQEEEYQTVIENAWRKDSGKSSDLHKKMPEGRKLFRGNGIGNSQDENALMMFANEF